MSTKMWGLALLITAFAMVLVGCASSSPEPGAISSSSPGQALGMGFDIDLVTGERALVQRSTLVVHATPFGPVEVVPVGREGIVAGYFQDVTVKEVLKGQGPGDTVRVLRTGINAQARAELEKTRRLEVFIEDEENLAGPLARGSQVLFLEPSAKPGVLQVVGIRQGAFPLDANGRITSAQEFKDFQGLSVPELRQKIEELSK